MIDIHCLQYSRAIRIVWLMEDLDQTYNMIEYKRTKEFRAPPELSEVHALGKSPVICDGDLTLAESATILRYLADKFDDTDHQPPHGSSAFWKHEEALDYVEGAFAAASLGVLLPALSNGTPSSSALKRFDQQVKYVENILPAQGLLFGDRPMLADIQYSYQLANLSNIGALSDHARLDRYWSDLQKQPGYRAAVEKAGPMAPETLPTL